MFVEGVIEYIWQTDRNIEIAPHIDRAKDLANSTVIKRILSLISSLVGKWTLLVISFVLNGILLLSLKASDDGPDTYDRWPQGEALAGHLCLFHVLYSCINLVHFVFVRNPVLAKVESRQKMIAKMGQSKTEQVGTYADFVSCTILVKDLPRGVTEAQVHEILDVYGEIQLIQIWENSSKTSEALVCFLQADSVDRVSEARVEAKASLWNRNSYFGLGFDHIKQASHIASHSLLRTSSSKVITGGPAEDPRRVVEASKISLEQAKRSTGTFSEQLQIAARKYIDGNEQDRSVREQVQDAVARGRNALSKLQGVLQVVTRALSQPDKRFADDDCGFVLATPKELMFSFRRNNEFYFVSLDLFFSLLGYFRNNLWFAYHLLHAFKMHGAKIVLRSLTRNFSRLALTILLALVAVYLMAIFGYTLIREDHRTGSDANVGNPGGACSTLLTCFVSYAFAGFTQTGLIYWLEKPVFPEGDTPEDFWEEPGALFDGHGTRLLFEMLFMVLITTVVVAIITGIIVDTFSELRAQQENALKHRKTTCFITGVSFMSVPEQKATSYMQYVFLIVFLRRKAHKAARPLTPLEHFIASKIDLADTSWLPSLGNLPTSRSSDQDEDTQSLDTLARVRLDTNEQTKSIETGRRLDDLEDKLADIVELLHAMSDGGAPQTVQLGDASNATAETSEEV